MMMFFMYFTDYTSVCEWRLGSITGCFWPNDNCEFYKRPPIRTKQFSSKNGFRFVNVPFLIDILFFNFFISSANREPSKIFKIHISALTISSAIKPPTFLRH